jgi:hypothetical protein
MWSVVPSFRFHVSVAASRKKFDFSPSKTEKALFVEETKIGLGGVPLHPKGHNRVRYSLVSTNYAMIMAEPSSFDLKAFNLERGRSFL